MKKLVNLMLPLFKWGTVIGTTAVVVLAIQANADTETQAQGALQPAALVPQDNKTWSPQTGFADLIEQVSPAVVHVSISGTVKQRPGQGVPDFNFPPGSPFEDFFKEFRKRQQPQQNSKKRKRPLGIGSGFIISADGYVVTNHHVVKDADEIIVTLTDGEEYEAELKGSDNKTDLALLKLKKAKDLPYVKFGDDDQSRVGDWVLAIGNPFGLGGTATTGIISARGRDIRSGPYDDYIQVDAAINRGNSGGPLFNLNGEVIGINTAIYSPNGGSVGIGFAIPSSLASKVISQLRESGEVERAWIGVQIQPLTDELAEGFDRKNDQGALVSSVVPGKPADNGGIQAGDIILEFDGEKIKEMRDLPRLVAQTDVGKKASIVVWRDGKRKSLTVVTDRFPDDNEIAGVSPDAESEATEDDVFGAQLRALDGDAREQYRIEDDVNGVLVVDVSQDGLAAANGIRAGDVLVTLDGIALKTPADVTRVVEEAQKAEKEKVVLLLQRNNNSRFVAFNLTE